MRSRGVDERTTSFSMGVAMLSVLIGILIICVVGAICFWAIEKFVRETRLANLLKLLVVLICLAAILQRVLPLAGISSF
jgi:NhaP-type Na+/H+ or K+/H+ antiporter